MGFRPPLPCDLSIPFLVSQTFCKKAPVFRFSAFKKLLLELLIGFSAWWAYTPLEMEGLPGKSILNPDSVSLVKEIVKAKLRVLQKMGMTESLQEQLQSSATEAITQRETFDPLGTIPESKPKEVIVESKGKKVLAVMVGAVLLVLILNESAAQFGQFT